MRHYPLSPLSVATTIIYRVVLHYNSAENETRYIIVTATERGDRGKCRIGFPSLTFQNHEEGGNKPPKRRFMN